MDKWLPRALAAFLCLSGCAPATPRPMVETKHWAVYYDDALPAKTFANLDLVVFDRRHYPDFKELKGKTTVLAYVSVGEVYDDVPEKAELEAAGALTHVNTTWKSHVVDVTSPLWHSIVLGYVADAEQKGFDGVMLDTMDSPLHWAETKQTDRLDAVHESLIDLVREIRDAHPSMKIMVNRGFSVLPLLAPDIDYILAESIYTKTDVSTGQFERFPRNTYVQVAEQLHHVTAIARQVQVFTLDYWNPNDGEGLEDIYVAQRARGFSPYVTTPDLRSFTPIPGLPAHHR